MRDKFAAELSAQMERAERQGRPHVEINAGELHRVVGGYPDAQAHRMPICCAVMREMQTHPKDELVYGPPEGDGASLTIRYVIPRGGRG